MHSTTYVSFISNICLFHSCKIFLAISLSVPLLAIVIANIFDGDLLRLLLGDASFRVQLFLGILLVFLLIDLIDKKNRSFFALEMALYYFQHIQQLRQVDVQFVHMIIYDKLREGVRERLQNQILAKFIIHGKAQLSQMSDQINHLQDMRLHRGAFSHVGMEQLLRYLISSSSTLFPI